MATAAFIIKHRILSELAVKELFPDYMTIKEVCVQPASTLPGSLCECGISDPTIGLLSLPLNKISRWFICKLQFETGWSNTYKLCFADEQVANSYIYNDRMNSYLIQNKYKYKTFYPQCIHIILLGKKTRFLLKCGLPKLLYAIYLELEMIWNIRGLEIPFKILKMIKHKYCNI